MAAKTPKGKGLPTCELKSGNERSCPAVQSKLLLTFAICLLPFCWLLQCKVMTKQNSVAFAKRVVFFLGVEYGTPIGSNSQSTNIPLQNATKQGCGIKGFIPTSAIQVGISPFIWGVSLWEALFVTYHRFVDSISHNPATKECSDPSGPNQKGGA